jgi:hypothetical protein
MGVKELDNKNSSFSLLALTLTLSVALVRLVPHPPNFAPIGGMALFGGARLRGWQAYLVPVLAMLVTDPILSHLHGAPAYSALTPIIYLSFMLNVLLGRFFLANTSNPARIASVALLGSLQFFVLTNFFVWLGAEAYYSRSTAGLIACYVSALPFFGRTVLADLFYSGVLFGAYSLVAKRFSGVQLRSAARG